MRKQREARTRFQFMWSASRLTAESWIRPGLVPKPSRLSHGRIATGILATPGKDSREHAGGARLPDMPQTATTLAVLALQLQIRGACGR